ncbi:MAG TPA: hypothetical protein VGS27_14975 [Candidatus Sulfotelmatobacter sp.]|nr:hypothetical protein [Candidatus Sulfotelmatobacter sp.]
MRTRLVLVLLCVYFAFFVVGCNKPPSDNTADNAPTDTQASAGNDQKGSGGAAHERREHAEHKEAEHKEAKREPLVVPAGTAINVSLGSAIGSKLSKSGDTFTGSIARDVVVGGAVAIPQGANVSGTVSDAKALGRFAGGASLQIRLDSINIKGADVPVQASAKTFTEKGKGKRTAVLAGGGAALGGIIGALAGGGKGAAIGAAAGAGAGTGGAAFTGNKEIVLPAESDVTFELSQPLEIRQ